MSKIEQFSIDDTEFPKISLKTKKKIKRVWHIVSFIISWITVGLYLWDNISSFLSYKFWITTTNRTDIISCLYAWLAFSIIGTILLVFLLYNVVIHSIKTFSNNVKCHSVPHQYSTFTSFYLYDIPRAIILLIIMIRFSIIIEDYNNLLSSRFSTVSPVYFLGYSKYDHIYFKIITDALKMAGLFTLAVIEFVHIIRKDKTIGFMIANSIGAAVHLSLLIASTVYKIRIESS